MKKLRVEISKDHDPVEVLAKAEQAGWSDDPGEGVAVLLLDERGNPAYEVFNPMEFAPPIGFEPTPPLEELIRDRVRAEFERLRDDDEIDDIIDAEDFDVPDELPPLETMYEVIAMERQAPALKPDRAKEIDDQAEYLDAVERALVMKRRHRENALKKQKEEIEDQLGRSLTGPGRSENLE